MERTYTALIGEDRIWGQDVRGRIAELEDNDDETERDELDMLRELDEQASGYIPDWPDETLIHERDFVSYAQELAEDIGAIPSDYSWPASHIDWDAAAGALQQDYTAVEIGGHTYWGR